MKWWVGLIIGVVVLAALLAAVLAAVLLRRRWRRRRQVDEVPRSLPCCSCVTMCALPDVASPDHEPRTLLYNLQCIAQQCQQLLVLPHGAQ